MLWETISSVVLGLALSWGALRALPDRLPSSRAVFLTGGPAALFGALLTHSALGTGHLLATCAGSLIVGTITLSLLIRPPGSRPVRSAAVH
ncbi:hypothetical protein [Streptomyces sp. NPDC048590]|uniref:hypothetical protein n=1 Tax=Streptomyces sp. NPDC048590 TaxID=3365574 RepID=UPI0037235F24